MVRDEHLGVVGVELAVDGGRVGEERQSGFGGFLLARVVVHGGGGGLDEPVAYFELLVGEVGGLPDGEAGGVAVPVVVGLGDVAHEVDFFAWVVVVDVFAVAGELVAAVFYAPESVGVSEWMGGREEGLLVVDVPADADVVALAVASGVAARGVVVA